MAKPFTDLSGSSCHLHILIVDEITNLNIFSTPNSQDDQDYYIIKLKHSEIACNIKMINFIGGVLNILKIYSFVMHQL